jgi:hypothetical protein
MRGRRLAPLLLAVGLLLLLPAATASGQSSSAAGAPTRVVVTSSRPLGSFDGRAYVEVQATMEGTVTRPDGSRGTYRVPLGLAYPTARTDCAGIGFVDLLHSTNFELFPTNNPADVLPLGRAYLGEPFLFGRGYVYAGVQWNKLVTDRISAMGTIERGTDGYAILNDSARFLRAPAAVFQGTGVPAPCSVPKVIAFGYSQPGMLLRHMFHPRTTVPAGSNPANAFAGVLIGGAGGRCRTLQDAPPLYRYQDCPGALRPLAKQIAVNTETDVELFKGWEAREETAAYRSYEVAGVAHISKRDVDLSGLGAARQNPMDLSPVLRAMVHHLTRWVQTGNQPPPSRIMPGRVATFTQPVFDIKQFFCFERDTAGNARGGIRLPPVEVPLGTFRGVEYGASFDPRVENCPATPDHATLPHFVVMLGGIFLPFAEEELKARYPTRSAYVTAVTRAADAALRDGHILQLDRDRYVREAQQAPLGTP